MKDFWNNTYRSIKSVYGNEPNEYFKTQLLKLKSGKLLLPAEGEGRNAVFAAKLGWEVSAFDFSKEAKIKAESKAKKNHVEIDYKLGTPNSLNYPENYFDCIALIYAHFPSNLKVSYHKKLSKYLRKNGIIIFEAFSKAHAELKAVNGKKSGPLDVNMLFSIEEIKNNFCNYKIIELKENQINLNEGLFHIGESKVIRFIGKKL